MKERSWLITREIQRDGYSGEEADILIGNEADTFLAEALVGVETLDVR